MSARATFVSGFQRLLSGEHADPRAAQGVFLVPVLVEVVFRLVAQRGLDAYLVAGLVILLVPTVASSAIGRGMLASRWTIGLPVLDLLALGALELSDAPHLGVLVAFPALWLGLEYGRRGVGVTVLTVLVAFAVPAFVVFGPTLMTFAQVTQVTLMAAICSAAVALTAELWKLQVDRNRSSTSRLELAMADLIEQRRLTRTIVNGVDIGLVAIDADGVYDSTNPRHQDFMDLAFPDGHAGIAGQPGFVYAGDGVTPLDREGMPTTRAANGEAFRDYLVWVGQDPNARRALAVSSTPYFRTNGTFGGAVLAYHDITELVLASRIKEEFVASVSHELRTPLTSIVGYVDIILDDSEDLPGDVRDYLFTVQRNARRLHRLVDDLLSTALQSVTTVLDVEQLSVTELLHRSAIEAAKSAHHAGLAFECDTTGAGDDLFINGDGERLAQVFDNLFSNAVKYTPAGGRVEACVGREGRHAVIQVSDTGRGIAPTELGEVFTKFFRSRTVLTDSIPGIGLGLAITKTIVDAHGGHITATSELGKGTTFEVRLPLAGMNAVSA